jgi:hypothetical protein
MRGNLPSVEGGGAMKRIAGCAVALAALMSAGAACAADEEIQVYMDEMNPQGGVGLDVHLNYVPQGRPADLDYAGQMASEHRWRITPEWAYGVTPNLELGLYLPVAAIDPDGGLEVGGVKGRIKFIAPKRLGQKSFWGANFELGRVKHSLDLNPWNAELKGIAGYRDGPWTVAGNLNIDWMVSGPDPTPVSYELAGKVMRAVREDLDLGVEAYVDLGAARRFARLRDGDQRVFLTADKRFGDWDLDLGVGYGFGEPEDRWILKAIVGVPIG